MERKNNNIFHINVGEVRYDFNLKTWFKVVDTDIYFDCYKDCLYHNNEQCKSGLYACTMKCRTDNTNVYFKPILEHTENDVYTILRYLSDHTLLPGWCDLLDTVGRKMSFGKYRGHSVVWVVFKHPSYISWVLKNTNFQMNEVEEWWYDNLCKTYNNVRYKQIIGIIF